MDLLTNVMSSLAVGGAARKGDKKRNGTMAMLAGTKSGSKRQRRGMRRRSKGSDPWANVEDSVSFMKTRYNISKESHNELKAQQREQQLLQVERDHLEAHMDKPLSSTVDEDHHEEIETTSATSVCTSTSTSSSSYSSGFSFPSNSSGFALPEASPPFCCPTPFAAARRGMATRRNAIWCRSGDYQETINTATTAIHDRSLGNDDKSLASQGSDRNLIRKRDRPAAAQHQRRAGLRMGRGTLRLGRRI